MKVLVLSPYPQELTGALKLNGDEVDLMMNPMLLLEEKDLPVDWIISYGYRRRISSWILERFKDRAINLHPSFLPWNRGTYPNLWSWYDDTPKGVTIHQLADEIDAGGILAQENVHLNTEHTLKSSYEALQYRMARLFSSYWPIIRTGKQPAISQDPGGTSHKKADGEKLVAQLPRVWNTSVIDVIELGKRDRETGRYFSSY
jgi:methionyl-tRNA formyltransferase